MLILPIKKKWFDLSLSGEKKEEYRALSPYYWSRFQRIFSIHPITGEPLGGDVHDILLRNGYSGNSPTIRVSAALAIRGGRPEWGAVPGEKYFVLEIQKIQWAGIRPEQGEKQQCS